MNIIFSTPDFKALRSDCRIQVVQVAPNRFDVQWIVNGKHDRDVDFRTSSANEAMYAALEAASAFQ